MYVVPESPEFGGLRGFSELSVAKNPIGATPDQLRSVWRHLSSVGSKIDTAATRMSTASHGPQIGSCKCQFAQTAGQVLGLLSRVY